MKEQRMAEAQRWDAQIVDVDEEEIDNGPVVTVKFTASFAEARKLARLMLERGDDLIVEVRRADAWKSEDDLPLPEDAAIKAAHPVRSDRHDLYAEAMRLVGARYSKHGLVALVNWLLHRIEAGK
ncbi:hypothetical protein AKJ09_00085 [Labilithrix luteola]|uniref:Uncharacterized protein n=1 Tax=Labilithrix luteola TaxID=1391654 RepID=A0A0K1PIH8_9BACT|nr:hypothetical protein [Labilithrix luteola]AKU93353.1 hypothetical protein AKJ09_00017 [Labilithrix luteola]AKU93421.1 hypothetical protein AKJ09_00085 [Labilithrix luteola]